MEALYEDPSRKPSLEVRESSIFAVVAGIRMFMQCLFLGLGEAKVRAGIISTLIHEARDLSLPRSDISRSSHQI